MLHRLILKVTKFQLPPKRLGTVVKNILMGHHGPPLCQIGLNITIACLNITIACSNITIACSTTKLDNLNFIINGTPYMTFDAPISE